jgi:hypothetical protein
MAAPGKALFWDKLKVKRGMREEITTFNDKALCARYPDPDLWFSEEVEDLGRRGGPTKKQKQDNINKSLQALSICGKCEVKDLCLQEGMRKENLDYGIWGGKMSGERLLMANQPIQSSDRINKVLFANKIREITGEL